MRKKQLEYYTFIKFQSPIFHKMNKRLFIQLTLLSIIVLITFLFYFKYLNNSDEITLLKVEESNKKVKNIIEDLKYFSKDIKGNEYTIEAKTKIARTIT